MEPRPRGAGGGTSAVRPEGGTLESQLSPRAGTALHIIREAGDIAKFWYEKSNYRIDSKTDGSPVTEADQQVERYIIDPIDGTRSFIHSVPLYANLIALEEAGEIVFGAINLPSAGVLVYAERGAGCWRNGKPARVSERARLDGAHVMATWLEDWRPETIRGLNSHGVI